MVIETNQYERALIQRLAEKANEGRQAHEMLVTIMNAIKVRAGIPGDSIVSLGEGYSLIVSDQSTAHA